MTTDIVRNEANPSSPGRSTGPRTPEGKARSSQNARKHGLSATQLKLEGEDREMFDAMQNELRASIMPEGELENALFDQLVFAQWNIRRARFLEEEYFAQPLAAQNEAKLRSIDRHARRHEASFHRAMRELTRLQTLRACRESTGHAPAQNEPDLPPLAEPRAVSQARRLVTRRIADLLTAAISHPPAPAPPLDPGDDEQGNHVY